MALDDVVKSAFNQLSTDDNLRKDVYNAVISSLSDTLQATAKQIEMQLDPKVNKSLKYTIEGFNINSTKDGIDPSQLYKDMGNIYKQNIFGNSTFSNISLLSTLYIRGLKKLGYPDPITGKREYATRQERENAQNIANIIAELLPESLSQYYNSIGKNVTKSEIMANLDKYASTLYGAYSGVTNLIGSYIISKTPNISLLESSTRLMSTLNETFLSTMEGSIYSMYSKVQIPEAVALILNKLGQIGLYNNTFNEMYKKIGSYIGQALQQPPQQAAQQPAGQGNQPRQPQGQNLPLAPLGAGGQGNPLGQQAQQGNRLVPPPQPFVIIPQNQQPGQQPTQISP
ncbi:hypothetical protein Nps_02690 [Candidatus Nanopusillus acidilobi]|nr:hypothetical protein Nps_02690 [Candidatus Nanopusillus acidilobi]